MTCNCLTDIDNKLSETGHKLDVAIFWCRKNNALDAKPYSRIMRKDNGKQESRRGKAKVFAFSYCPFCGSKYEEPGQ